MSSETTHLTKQINLKKNYKLKISMQPVSFQPVELEKTVNRKSDSLGLRSLRLKYMYRVWHFRLV